MARFKLLPVCCKISLNHQTVLSDNNTGTTMSNSEISEGGLGCQSTNPCETSTAEFSLSENPQLCSSAVADQGISKATNHRHKIAGEYKWLKETTIIEPKFFVERKKQRRAVRSK